MMKRRELIVALGLCVLAAPLVSHAQTPTGVPRIGFMQDSATPFNKARFEAFRQGLRELGYVEGKTVVIEYRNAEGKFDRLPALAAELLGLKVNIIVADGGAVTALAAKGATRTVPIVFPAVADPVSTGLVANLARPGGNLTGLSLQSPDTAGKRLQLLKEIVPRAKRIAFLVNPSNTSTAAVLREVQTASRTLGLEVQVVEAQAPAEFDVAFAEIARKRADALIVFPDSMFVAQSARIAALAAKLKLPTMGDNSALPESGGLVSYGANRLDMLRRAAIVVDKILKGAKPATLPVDQPSKFDLILNLKTAKALGLTIPPAVLLRADKVIE
jgi:putative ABC transport system substrate-binding protein